MYKMHQVFTRTRAVNMAFIAAAAIVGAFGIMSLSESIAQPRLTIRPKFHVVRVLGTLAVDAKASTNDKLGAVVELPDIVMELRLPGQTTALSKAETRLDGHFVLKAPRPGLYNICQTVAGILSCDNRIVVGNDDIWTSTIFVALEKPIVFGTVRTADGRPCWINDHFFNLDVSTRAC